MLWYRTIVTPAKAAKLAAAGSHSAAEPGKAGSGGRARPIRLIRVARVGQGIGVAAMLWATGQLVAELPSVQRPASAVVLPNAGWAPTLAIRLGLVAAFTWLAAQNWGPAALRDALAWKADRLQHLGYGLLLGLLLAAAVAFVESFFGWWGLAGVQPVRPLDLAEYGGLLALNAVMIELVFRGYLLQKLNTSFSFWVSALISSALYAAMTLLASGASALAPGTGALALGAVVTTFVVRGVLGLLLCYLFYMGRSLWLTMAFSLSWTFCIGVLFAFPGSSVPPSSGLGVLFGTSPAWLTGGAWGPEAGAITVLVALVGQVLIWNYARQTSA